MKATPGAMARLAGALYLISGVPAGFSVYVSQKLVVHSDPAATANNILGSEALFRLGFVADLVGILIFLGAVLLLYQMFRPVSRSVSLLMVFFALVGAAVQAVDSVGAIAALLLLKGGSAMAALTTGQSQALALLFLKLNTLLYVVALLFFGASSLVIAWLVLRSIFLPRVLGVLMAIDGLGYLVLSCATFLSPPLARHLHPFLPFVTAIIGEASFVLWLVVKGVNAQRWEEQARSAG